MAEEELLPLLREKVSFPEWLMGLVLEYGLEHLRICDVWAPGTVPAVERGSRKKTHPASSATMENPTANEMLSVLRDHEDGATSGDLARVFNLSQKQFLLRLRTLMVEGLVCKFGIGSNTKYELSDLGSERLEAVAKQP